MTDSPSDVTANSLPQLRCLTIEQHRRYAQPAQAFKRPMVAPGYIGRSMCIGAETVTVTKNEILTALNEPDDHTLALVEVHGDAHDPRYLRRPFHNESGIEVTSVSYRLDELMVRRGATAMRARARRSR